MRRKAPESGASSPPASGFGGEHAPSTRLPGDLLQRRAHFADPPSLLWRTRLSRLDSAKNPDRTTIPAIVGISQSCLYILTEYHSGRVARNLGNSHHVFLECADFRTFQSRARSIARLPYNAFGNRPRRSMEFILAPWRSYAIDRRPGSPNSDAVRLFEFRFRQLLRISDAPPPRSIPPARRGRARKTYQAIAGIHRDYMQLRGDWPSKRAA